MKLSFATMAAALAVASAAVGVQAQELKIGYVNSDRVLRDAVPAKAAQAKLEAEKYDLILQEAVFAGPRADITDKVIKALNAQGSK